MSEEATLVPVPRSSGNPTEKDWRLDDKKARASRAETYAAQRAAIPVLKGFIATLTPEQKAAAVAYTGPDGPIGDMDEDWPSYDMEEPGE